MTPTDTCSFNWLLPLPIEIQREFIVINAWISWNAFFFFFLLPLCAWKLWNTPRDSSLRDTCPQMQTLIHKATSLLSASLSEGKGNLSGSFLKHMAPGDSFKFGKLLRKFPMHKLNLWPLLTPPLHRHSTFLPQIFQKARQRSLPSPARLGLRQLPALANRNPERGMQITVLGTVNKVLNRLTHN